jgi:ribonuclease D
MLQGWRWDAFGKDALALVEGKLAFAVKNGRMLMTRVEDAPAEERLIEEVEEEAAE